MKADALSHSTWLSTNAHGPAKRSNYHRLLSEAGLGARPFSVMFQFAKKRWVSLGISAMRRMNYGKIYNYLYTRRLARLGNLASGVAGFASIEM